MSRMKMDLEEMPGFFKGIEEVCADFAARQTEVDCAFNAVQETWRDKNTVTTYNRLSDVAHDLSTFYDSLRGMIEYIAQVCNNRAEYVDAVQISSPRIDPFTVNLTEVTMDNNVIDTDSEALIEFKDALDKYINSITENVNKLNGLYSRIGDSWDDAQYQRFGDELRAFSNKMQSQVDILDTISQFLRAKIELLNRSDI